MLQPDWVCWRQQFTPPSSQRYEWHEILTYRRMKINTAQAISGQLNDTSNIDTYDDRCIPTGRPIAEPPMFDYDEFTAKEVPSKRRNEALFAERRDIEKRVKFGDTDTELELLEMYFFWVADIANHPK